MNEESTRDLKTLVTRHLQIAWWSLLCFVVLGITLEALHAFKVESYLGSVSETRRLMWRLAHAHGTLLSLVHAAFAFTHFVFQTPMGSRHRFASAFLIAASVLLPGGFFLGGAFVFDGDPGLGIWLVPLGASCLFLTVLVTAIDVVRGGGSPNAPPSADKRKS